MATPGASAALIRCALFKDFSETGLSILASIAQERSVPTGAPLFVEGMAADAFFVVKKGHLRIAMKGSGADRVLGTLGTGESLGQLSLLTASGVRLVSALAVDAVEVVEIRQRDFQRLQAQKPQACLKLMMAIAAELGSLLNDNRELLRNLGA